MANGPRQEPQVEWRIAAQRFSGTLDEVSAQVDQLILGLVALRQRLPPGSLVVGPQVSQPEPVPSPARRLWTRLFWSLGLVLCLWLAPARAWAQAGHPATSVPSEPWRHVVFGLTFEGDYEWNANRPPDRANVLHAYDTRADTFGIQQVASVVELAPDPQKGRRFGLRLDLQAGQATETLQGSALNEPRPDVYRHVWQAFGSFVFPVGRGVRADFGKFASNLGVETNYAKDNQAFSRALLFYFLPFYHAGLRVSCPVGGGLSLMYALTNGVQQTEEFNNFKSQQVSATLVPVNSLNWTMNYYAGSEQPDHERPHGPDGVYRVFDTYATWNATSRLGLALDVNHTTNGADRGGPTLSLDGLGAYARWQVVPQTAVGIRYEHLDDEGLVAGVQQLLEEVTVTLEQRVAEGLLVRLEYRRDWSNVALFPSDEGLRDSQPTVLAGAIWWFGNKTGTW